MLPHHVGLTDIVIITGVIGYLVLQVKDFRPIRALRQENTDLRSSLSDLQRKYDDLEHRYGALEKSRDFQASFDLSLHAIAEARSEMAREHAAIGDALIKHGEEELKAWMVLQREMAANTAVLSTLAAGINAGALAASAPRRTRGTP